MKEKCTRNQSVRNAPKSRCGKCSAKKKKEPYNFAQKTTLLQKCLTYLCKREENKRVRASHNKRVRASHITPKNLNYEVLKYNALLQKHKGIWKNNCGKKPYLPAKSIL